MEVELRELIKHEDERGLLVELLRGDEIKEEIKQIYFSISKPGAVRGNHYHKRKVEWFCVVKGKVKFVVEGIQKKDRREFILDDENLVVVKVPPYIIHSLKNVGNEDVHLIVVANEMFTPNDPDTFFVKG